MNESNTTGITKLKCQRCGHEWAPRSEQLPKVCPKCKRYDWNVPYSARPQKTKKRRGGAYDVKTEKGSSRSPKSKRRRREPSAIETFRERMSATK